MADDRLILSGFPDSGLLALNARGQVATTYQDATEASRPPQTPISELSPNTDVVIIGGGFMGLSYALQLAEKAQAEGKQLNISLVESGRIGFGASGRSGGHIDGALEASKEIKKEVFKGARGLRRQLEKFGEEGPANIRALVGRWGINCKMGKDYMWLNFKRGNSRNYEDDGELFNLDPYPLVQGYAAAARRLGVKIFEETPVIDVARGANGQIKVITPRGEITAPKIVSAAGPATESIPVLRDIARSRTVNLPVSTIITPPLPEKVRVAILDRAGKEMMPGAQEKNPNEDVAFWHFDHEGRMIFGVGISTTSKVNTHAIAEEMYKIFPKLRAAYKSATGQDFSWEVFTKDQNLDYCASWMPHVASFSIGNNGRAVRDPNGQVDMVHGFGGYGIALSSIIADGLAQRTLDQRAGRRVSPDNAFELFSQVKHTDLPVDDLVQRLEVKQEIAGETAEAYTVPEGPAGAFHRPEGTSKPSAPATPPDPRLQALYDQHASAVAAGQVHFSADDFRAIIPYWARTFFDNSQYQNDGIRLQYADGSTVHTSLNSVVYEDEMSIDATRIRAGMQQAMALWGSTIELEGSPEFMRIAAAVARVEGVTITNYTPPTEESRRISQIASELPARFQAEDAAAEVRLSANPPVPGSPSGRQQPPPGQRPPMV